MASAAGAGGPGPATQALTVLAPIDPARRAELEARLARIASHLDSNDVFRPGALPDTHFTRFVILDDPRGELAPLLAWESNHDGRAAAYLAAVARAAPAIERIFECCADYPPGLVADADAWAAWQLARSHRAAAFYTGYRGVPRARVLNDRRVHDAIRAVIDGLDRRALADLPRAELQRRICAEVRARHPELDTTATLDTGPAWRTAGAIALGLAILGALFGLPIWRWGAAGLLYVPLPCLLLLFLGYLQLRRHETRDIASWYARPVEVEPRIRDLEDQVTQNQLTHVVELKPGRFRLVLLTLVLGAIDVLARLYFVHGALGGITAIHFARWVIVRDRRPGVTPRHRLVFFSNYDGSWESYLGEFIDRAAEGLTAVWSNTRGFPATAHLMFEGARDEDAFKQWTREHQVFTQVWWSGVPDSTVQNVLDDLWIRSRLDRGLGDRELERWLAKL
jgi:hypothetical protein